MTNMCAVCGSHSVVGFRKLTVWGLEYPRYEFLCSEHLKKHPLVIEK